MIFLADLKDPRTRINECEHKFIDILIIAIYTIMSDGESWEDMETFGHAKEDWLRTLLELPYGIPSHDTFYRIFCALDPETFEACFIRWVKSFFSEALPLGVKWSPVIKQPKQIGQGQIHRFYQRHSDFVPSMQRDYYYSFVLLWQFLKRPGTLTTPLFF